MTVLLVLFFIIAALAVDALVEYRRKYVPSTHRIRSIVQEIFEHDGICPTMADGGTPIEQQKGKTP